MSEPILFTAVYDSPCGPLELISDGTALIKLAFAGKIGKAAGSPCPLLKKAFEQLDGYFAGKRRVFDLPLSFAGTDFQKRVWQALTRIPFGETSSYAGVARAIRKPLAMRAVGGANNKNPIAIIVPCHRVIGADGNLVGYGGGLAKKKWLLKHEGVFR